MTSYVVDPTEVGVHEDDLALWLLSYLESHGAVVTLTPDEAVTVDLEGLHLDARTADRWARVTVRVIPEMRLLLLARRAAAGLTLH